MGYKVNKHLCVVALARTTIVVDITQRLQSEKSLTEDYKVCILH